MTDTPPFTSRHPRLRALGAAARWILAVAACLWISLCVAVGPLYWEDSSIANFSAANWTYFVIAFIITFGIVVALVRWAHGIPMFGWKSGQHQLTPRRIIPQGIRRAIQRFAYSHIGVILRYAGSWVSRLWIRSTDRWWKIALILFIGWLWVPTTLLSAFGADIRSQAREFSWAWNQWTGLEQPYIGFFSFVPMDIYPTAHYIWPSQPTYLTDQHNIMLTVLYGSVLAVSRYFTDSNDWGFITLSAAQMVFAVFCCSATAHRFLNLPWVRHNNGNNEQDSLRTSRHGSQQECMDFAHPERRQPQFPITPDFTHPERVLYASSRNETACAVRLTTSSPLTVRNSLTSNLPTGHAGWFARLIIILFFLLCPLAVFSTISLTKSPLFAFSFVWAFGIWYELHMTWSHNARNTKATAAHTTDTNNTNLRAISRNTSRATVIRLRKRSLIAFTLASIVMLASAKYAWYIIIMEIVLALIADRQRWRTYIVALLLPVIVMHGGVVMLTSTGAIIGGDPIESRGIQLQQIARIAKRDPQSIPLSARETIAPIFNLDQMADAYFQQDADPVKSSGIQSKKVSYRWRSVTSEAMDKFNDAWWQIVTASPVTAIDAFLAKCFGYFNPVDSPYVSMDYYVTSDYVTQQTDWIRFWWSDWRKTIATKAHDFGNIPVIGWLAHGNFYVTLTLLIGAAEVIMRRWRTLVMHLPLLLLMGVMITAPANNFERHMLPVAFVFGFVVLTYWRESQQERQQQLAKLGQPLANMQAA